MDSLEGLPSTRSKYSSSHAASRIQIVPSLTYFNVEMIEVRCLGSSRSAKRLAPRKVISRRVSSRRGPGSAFQTTLLARHLSKSSGKNAGTEGVASESIGLGCTTVRYGPRVLARRSVPLRSPDCAPIARGSPRWMRGLVFLVASARRAAPPGIEAGSRYPESRFICSSRTSLRSRASSSRPRVASAPACRFLRPPALAIPRSTAPARSRFPLHELFNLTKGGLA